MCLGDTPAPPQGIPPRLAPHRTRTRRPSPPTPPNHRNGGPFDDAELSALYGIHATAPLSELVPVLREHHKDVETSRLFAVVGLPHAATTELFLRQLKALVTPGTQLKDDLVDAWIWWFNTHQPDQGGIWVPHLGRAHTLIAPRTDSRPAPSTGGRERGRPATESRNPPHPTVRRPGGIGKQDSPQQGA